MELKAGDLVARRYVVERELDAPSRRVFVAFDNGASRQVVLKFVRPGALEEKSRVRFQRELEIVANLRHPHTVKLFSHDQHDGVPFMVFEYVPGENLAELILRGPWSMGITQRVVSQLLGALDEAHKQGVVHRDVCPQNVRVFEHLTEAWNIKLVGFGLGRPVGSSGASLTVTATGELLGVPRYLAPEVVRGEAHSPPSDLYGVGIVVLELLLGPDALGVGSNVVSPDVISKAIDRVPPPLGPVVRRMLSPDPTRRFASAAAVEAALAATSAPESSAGEVAEVAPPAPPQRRVSAIVLGLALAAAFVAFLVWPRPDSSTQRVAYSKKSLGAIVKGAAIAPAPGPKKSTAPEVSPRPDLGPAAARTGCGMAPPFTGLDRLVAVSGALEESSWPTLIPNSYEPEHPHALVVLLHGNQQSARGLLEHGGFVPVAHKHAFVAVAVEDEVFPAWKDGSDRAKIETVVEETKRRLCIDDARVFLVGHSQGGHILDTIMCNEWVKGVAFSSHRGAAAGDRCMERPVPTLLLNPKDSRNIPYDGGLNCSDQLKSSVSAVEAKQRERNRCKFPRRNVFRSKNGRCVEWQCETPLRSCAIEGGDGWHGVPLESVFKSIPINLDPCRGADPRPFPIAEQVWDFFRQIE